MKAAAAGLMLCAMAHPAGAFAPATTFLPRPILSRHGAPLQAAPRSQSLCMNGGDGGKNMLPNFAKSFATTIAALAIMAGGAHDADAARSGGRVGGRSFSAPAPTRSYSAPRSAPSYSGSYGGGGTAVMPYRSTTIVPVPIMPGPVFSPFGYGYGGYYGGGVSVIGGGPNLFSLLLVGGLIYTASQLLSAQVSSSGGWGAVDVESSSLGRGVGVLKLQVALNCSDRTRSGILGQLKTIAERAETGSRGGLSAAVSEAALALVRRQSDWLAACSKFEYFPARAAERSEAVFNSFAIAERSKVERETVARFGGEDLSDARDAAGVKAQDIGRPTQAVVTLVLALRGESLRRFELERSINSATALRNVLTQVAGDAVTDDGDNVLGVELLWTPEEPWESLDRQAIIEDFPELLDL